MEQFFEMFSKFFSDAAVDDEVDGGVDGQEEVVEIGEEVHDDRDVILSLLIAQIIVLEDRLFGKRELKSSKCESIGVAGDENEHHRN